MAKVEYAVRLTVDGALTAWEQGSHSFEKSISELAAGLVAGAFAIDRYRKEDGAEGWATELAQTWWEDLDKLPAQARRLTLTRMIVAGIPEPIRYQYTTDDGD